MNFRFVLGAVLASFLNMTNAEAGDATAGRAKAEPCMACHGEKGISELDTVPSLAGQPAYYLLAQILLFRSKQRDVETMTPFAEGLSDEDADDLAAFFSAQTPATSQSGGNAAVAAQAGKLVEAGHCASCHLPDFSGREQMARLAGQREDYLLKALRDFKTDQRSGFDGSMSEVVYPLSDQDLQVLAAYLAHFR